MGRICAHIDVADNAAASFLSAIVREMGWDVTQGAQEPAQPDILITRPERLQEQRVAVRRLDQGPQILLWADPAEVQAGLMLGVRVHAFLGRSPDGDTVRKTLDAAAQELRQRREEFAMWSELEERYAEASVLLNLALEVGPEMKMEDVLERIVDYISRDLGYRIVSIMLVDEDDGALTIQASKGLSEKIVKTSRMEMGKGVSGSVAQSGEPLLVKDVTTDPRFGKGRSHGRYSSKSLICVPLKVGNRVLGVLNANNKGKEGPLNDHDLRILSIFAAHASVSIERARLYRNIERKATELAEAYEKLRAVDKVKSDFIINVSHEYRTPVTIILGYLELLRGSLDQPELLEKVNTAMEAASRLSALIDDSTELLRLDTGTAPFHFQVVSVHSFLEEAVRGQWTRFGTKGVDLSLDLPEELPPVRVDPDKMIRLMDKLLDNALKFTPAGGFTRVEASRDTDGKTVHIAVQDSGPGIHPGDSGRVFERFEQGGDIMTEKPEGTGLGLAIVRAIAARHQGTIALDEKCSGGCRILVSIPAHEA